MSPKDQILERHKSAEQGIDAAKLPRASQSKYPIYKNQNTKNKTTRPHGIEVMWMREIWDKDAR